MIGQTLAHYRILEKLGEGGMGAVFLAEDSRLRREVALKVLPAELASQVSHLERFRREAQAVAALSHPNIVTIFSIESDGDRHFLTMEAVRGKDLSRLIAGDGLSAQRVVELAVPMVGALSAAHAAGIVHRDLKPANVMVSDDGTVKILDFGLAKLQPVENEGSAEAPTRTVTQLGTMMGTVPYMSPEQVQGKTVDARTDIFSLGVLLYEMCTGQRPFRGENPADTISAILRDAPAEIADVRPDLPGQLGRIVDRCLEKDPDLRYQSADDIGTALSKIGETVEETSAQTSSEALPSVAVLPFVDMSPEKDQDYFCEGLAEELINALFRVEGLRIASRTSAFRFKDSESDIKEIGRRLEVSSVLEGSVRKSGNQVRISVQLVSVRDGYQLWSNRYDRELKDVFVIQDEIAQKVVEALQLTLTPKAKQAAEKAMPVDVQAYDFYLKGRKSFYEFHQRGFEVARQMFARAIEIDENYVRAYAGVADCCSFLYMYYDASEENLQEARDASRKAVEIDPESPEAHASRGLALSVSGQYAEAEAEFQRSIELDPKLYEAHYFFARSLFSQGRSAESAESFERACEVQPDDYQAPFFLAQSYLRLGRRAYAAAGFRKAVDQAKKHLAFHPDDPRALYLGGAALAELGDLVPAQEWVARAVEIDPDDANTLYNVACIYAQLGKNDGALDCLERAVDSGMGEADWIANDPYFDPLRDTERFEKLMARLKGRREDSQLGSVATES